MIRVEQLTKRYGETLAVDGVSFAVRPGEVVGFLGPNGAGKSTVLKVLSTWLRPSSGTAAIAGHDVVREPLAVRRALGYLPEHNALYETMRVDRLLDFVGKMRGLSRARLAERTNWVVEHCGVGDVLGKRIHQCSKGYRQRIGVAAALLHDPAVILLDEPTHGLDVLQVQAFLDFVRELAPTHAILFSSHVLAEVVSVSDRLLVIHRGRILVDERVEELERRASAAGGEIEDFLLEIVRRGRLGGPQETGT